MIALQLVTFTHQGRRRIGVHVDDQIIDPQAALAERFAQGGEGHPDAVAEALIPGGLKGLIERGEPGLAQVRAAVDFAKARSEAQDDPSERRLSYGLGEVGIHAPLLDPGKIVAVGLNYLDHAAESQMEAPKQPLFFSKYASCIVGPGSPIVLPPDEITDEVDYEVELAVVIGKAARNVSEEEALDHVFGYSILNDVSARDLQFEDGQWDKGKTLDTFAPLGPWVVTKDEIPDPQSLRIVLALNGELLQDSNTEHMIFSVARLISYFSRLFTLHPGDIISTGTPPGVGFARDPKRFLKPGDTVVAEIQGVGSLENPVVRAE